MLVTFIPFHPGQLLLQVSIDEGHKVSLLEHRISNQRFQQEPEATIMFNSMRYIVFGSESGDVFDILHAIDMMKFGPTETEIEDEGAVSRIKYALQDSPLYVIFFVFVVLKYFYRYAKGKWLYEGLKFEETTEEIEKQFCSLRDDQTIQQFARFLHLNGQFTFKGFNAAIVRKVCLEFYNLVKTKRYFLFKPLHPHLFLRYQFIVYDVWKMIHWLFVVRFFFFTPNPEEKFKAWMERYLQCLKQHPSLCSGEERYYIVKYLRIGLPQWYP